MPNDKIKHISDGVTTWDVGGDIVGHTIEVIFRLPANYTKAQWLTSFPNLDYSQVDTNTVAWINGQDNMSAATLQELAKVGPVYVKAYMRTSTGSSTELIADGYLSEKYNLTTDGGTFLCEVKKEHTYDNRSYALLRMNNDKSVHGFSLLSYGIPTLQNIIIDHVIDSDTCTRNTFGASAKDVFESLLYGAPLPIMTLKSANGTTAPVNMAYDSAVCSKMMITQGSVNVNITKKDLPTLISVMGANVNDVYTIKLYYKGLVEQDGSKSDYEISFTIKNKKLTTSTTTDFTFSDFTINRTTVV